MKSPSVWFVHGRVFGIFMSLFLFYAQALYANGYESCAKYEKGLGSVFACGSQLCRKKKSMDSNQENWCSIDSFRSYRGRILDSYQEEFLVRGVNNPHVWFGNEALNALPSIASLGFNSVRVVWTIDQTQDDLANVLHRILQLKMIPILELHDLTGRSEPWELLALVDKMISRFGPILVGKEDRLLINIANEWGGHILSHESWRDTYRLAVKKLRDAGLHHLLIIDAAGWAQDPSSILKYGREIYEADPVQNVAFSLHLYEKWRSAYHRKFPIAETFARLKQTELTILIGEFAQQHDFHLEGSSTTICFNPIDYAAQEKYLASVYRDGYRPTQADFAIDFKEIMRQAHQFNMGYLAWSWHGNGRSNNCYLDYLDIARQWDVGSGRDFQPQKLSYWGCELVKNLEAQTARIFGSPDSGWSRYGDLSCSAHGNFHSCNRFGGGYGDEFSCGSGRRCRKSTTDTQQSDQAYWCAVDQ